jgi:hypothetical protein
MAKFIEVKYLLGPTGARKTINIDEISSFEGNGNSTRLILKRLEDGKNVELIVMENYNVFSERFWGIQGIDQKEG